jgi:hypothetical protein
MKLPHLIALSGLVVLLLLGCSVSQDLTVAGDGSGTAELSIDIHPIMISYYNDLMVAMSGVEGECPVFDLEALAASFDEREGVELEAMELRGRGSLSMTLRFTDANALSESGEIVTFERNGRRRTISVSLDRAAIDEFLGFAPEETVSMTEYLFPPADGSVSREEYEEQMAWALEEYGDPALVRSVLREAVIEVRVVPEGRIIQVEGGERSGSSVIFRVPVIEALTLPESRLYSLSFEL